ncbi:hypothetical protein JAAARDRAFT_130697 [Jaapia argillacea MUCL 33604]|uniref:LAG1-DNAbind-domain-containing protein n=1 Tax=Jaapia argillacea MUCL 33604 TaxID=933084 RepID=A0A067PVB7_9AGAM|nr:hypothetical protein JAAARDRAFT_130697 [Jaapia argillacea MUCL 33604]
MAIDSDAPHPSAAPRPLPPPSELTRWDLAEILNPSSRDKRMSMDFSAPASNQAPHGIYGQAELDQAFSSLQNVDTSSAQHSLGSRLNGHGFDHSEALDMPDQSGFDIFSNSTSSNSFTSQRYRTNASSSSSLGPNYGVGADSIYSHTSFGDSVPSFHGGSSNPYDVVHSLSSSYSSGKVSPLTPSDSIPSVQHSPVFPTTLGSNGLPKDFGSHHSFADMVADRRLSNVNNGSYPPEFHEEYGVGVPGGLGLGFPSNGSQPLGRYSLDSRFPTSSIPSQLQHHSHDIMQGVSPQATNGFRPHGMGYDDVHHFLNPNPQMDMSLRMPGVDGAMARMGLHGPGGMSANDLQTFIRPYLDQYVRTPNRLAFGERTVIVMSSKVAQKSYGTEKRFLCPPPTAIMIGNSWWSDVVRRGQEPKLCSPRVVVSISGEPSPPEGNIDWCSASGKSFDVNDPPTGTTYVGRCVGKQLFISDVDEKKKKVEALVKIMAPSSDDEPERVIGTFPSKPIKVISKPSKKRQSAKNLELCINHGSTISLFHRLRSQTVSTKYLCVSGSGSAFKGSDGAPLMGLDNRSRTSTPSFIARTASWDPFVMYIVDVNKPAGGIDAPPPPPPHPEYPSPPPNAIAFTNNGSQIPIYYNQTVVLQCLTSGVVSPVLIIRKVDHATTVVGGGLQEGAKGIADHYCSPGEVCGDPVSQLHKIAFEVYEAGKGMPDPGTPGLTGAFLSCMGEKVNTYRPVDGRIWVNPPGASRGSVSPSTQSPAIPGSPVVSTPASLNSGNDYFTPSVHADSAPASPTSMDFPSNDGGRVKKPKRGSSSTGGISKSSASAKGRRRPNSAGSGGSPGRRQSSGETNASSGALWQVDIGETSVWTIVGTDQVRYNFYVPPVLYDNQNAPPSSSYPIPSKPVTPFPAVVKYLPPDRAAEAPKSNCAASRAVLAKPNPSASKMLTVYGENFSKADPVNVFFGSEPSPYVEVRCTEVLGCLPPDAPVTKRRPIILVRHDGVVFPSNTMYP